MKRPILPQIGRYIIPTNQIEEFVNIVCLWSRQCVPGGLVYGNQRAGKSTAVARFTEVSHAIFNGHVGCVSTEVEPDTVKAAKPFWGGLLRAMDVNVPGPKSAEARRDWFIGRIIEAAVETPSNKVVVLVDEASLLSETTWLLLLGVDNQLRHVHDVDVTWVFVGQPELADAPAILLGVGRREVVGRFMADRYCFRELSGLADFERALSGFDTVKREGEKCSLSERAHPEKFARGWRFRDEKEVIFRALQAARDENGLVQRDGLTMQAFVRLASHLIVETIPALSLDESLTLPLIYDAIMATDCLMFERHAELMQATANLRPE